VLVLHLAEYSLQHSMHVSAMAVSSSISAAMPCVPDTYCCLQYMCKWQTALNADCTSISTKAFKQTSPRLAAMSQRCFRDHCSRSLQILGHFQTFRRFPSRTSVSLTGCASASSAFDRLRLTLYASENSAASRILAGAKVAADDLSKLLIPAAVEQAHRQPDQAKKEEALLNRN
jgi:hypothetical protein